MKAAREFCSYSPNHSRGAEAMQSHDSLSGMLVIRERQRPQGKGTSPGKRETPGFQLSPLRASQLIEPVQTPR